MENNQEYKLSEFEKEFINKVASDFEQPFEFIAWFYENFHDQTYFCNIVLGIISLNESSDLIKEQLPNWFSWVIKDDIIILQIEDVTFELYKIQFYMILMNIKNFGDEVLPLGSVVSLNSREVSEEIKFVITNRYVVEENQDYYYQYQIEVYPYGTLLNVENLTTTNENISKIHFKGYVNEFEKQFIEQIKRDIFLNTDLYSYFDKLEEKQKYVAQFFEEA